MKSILPSASLNLRCARSYKPPFVLKVDMPDEAESPEPEKTMIREAVSAAVRRRSKPSDASLQINTADVSLTDYRLVLLV